MRIKKSHSAGGNISLYSSIIRKAILPLILKRENRGSSLSHWHFFEGSQYWPKQKLLDFQWLKLKELLKHSYLTSPYYKKVFKERNLTPDSFNNFDDIVKLPILTRTDLFDYPTEILSTKFTESEIHHVVTGGTTGQQATLYRDQESFNIKQGMAWRHEGWMGKKPCDRMAYVWPAHADYQAESTWKTKLKNRYLIGDSMYYAGSFKEEAFAGHHQDIMKFRPKFIKAFPMPLEAFTQYLLDKKLKTPRLVGIMSTGEVLHDRQRLLFENTYDCPAFDMYGSREVGNSSSECAIHEGLHIAMETSFVEFVNDGKSVQPGDEGEILITDLTNYAFPMIRYQINDRGMELVKSCSCGRHLTLMSPGIGRVQDNFYTPDGRKHSGIMLLFHTSSDHDIKIGQIQIVQKTLTDFHVRITNKPEPNQDVFDFIQKQLKNVVGENINITTEVVEELPREKSGKTRSVICEIDNLK